MNLAKTVFLSAFLVLSICFYILPQADINNKIVGHAGRINITEDEFLHRYEFTPFVTKGVKKGAEVTKEEFLYTLIAEKLWALQAEKLGLDTSEVIRFSAEQFEKMFVKDALYHKEIKDKISVSEEELIAGYLKYTTKLKINFLFSEDAEEIKDLYNLMNEGIPFDSILAESPELEEQGEPIEVSYGQMQDEIEDSLYLLKPGAYTAPINTPDGWYIFRLVNKAENLMNTETDRQEAFKSVEKIISARKETEIYNKYYREFFKNQKVDADGNLYKLLVTELQKIFDEKYALKGVADTSLLSLKADDVLKLEERIGENNLSSVYINLNSHPITLKYYIRLLAFDGLNLKPEEISKMPEIIFSRNRTIIENELLAEEGIKKGYNLLPEVQNDLSMWKENYLFQALRSKFLDSVAVTEDEALQYYQARNEEEKYPALVNIVEVLSDSAEVIEHVMNEIKNGADIRELAKIYTKRVQLKNKNGETGLVPAASLGEIGLLAYKMNIGEVFGPVKLTEGFSVFKLIDKKDERIEQPRSYESSKNDIMTELSFLKLKRKMDNYTVQLAKTFGAEINEDVLKQVEVTEINSFGMRYLGFGGKVTAVPMVSPDYDWVGEYLDEKNIIQ